MKETAENYCRRPSSSNGRLGHGHRHSCLNKLYLWLFLLLLFVVHQQQQDGVVMVQAAAIVDSRDEEFGHDLHHHSHRHVRAAAAAGQRGLVRGKSKRDQDHSHDDRVPKLSKSSEEKGSKISYFSSSADNDEERDDDEDEDDAADDEEEENEEAVTFEAQGEDESSGDYIYDEEGYVTYPYPETYFLPVNSVGFEKCYDLLASLATDNKVFEQQYLEFLERISDGDLTYSKCSDLPAELYVLFYATACSSGQDCKHHAPFIAVEKQGVNLSLLRFFCQEALTYTNTETSMSFEFSIRYAADISSDQASACLSKAVEMMLLDNFGCQIDDSSDQVSGRRVAQEDGGGGNTVTAPNDDGGRTMKTSLLPKRVRKHKQSPSSLIRHLNVRQRPLSFDSSSSDWHDSACAYTVTNDINILNFGCIPPEPEVDGIECGLAQATVNVIAKQVVEPSEEALYDEVTQALREAINSGNLKQYFPPDCQFQS